MDDLSGLDWSAPPAVPKSSTPVYPTLRPSPAPSSGRSTPNPLAQNVLSSSQPSMKIGPRSTPPAADSFASLLSNPKSKAPSNNLSLQERQRQLLEERNKQSRQLDSQFGSQTSLSISSTTSTTNGAANSRSSGLATAFGRGPGAAALQPKQDDQDILAAFNSSAKVDSSSHFPPTQTDAPATQAPAPLAWDREDRFKKPGEDDDPFDLSQFKAGTKQKQSVVATVADDDADILGMLGRPVEEIPVKTTKSRIDHDGTESPQDQGNLPSTISDRAVVELVDMGFTADQAAIALAQTESGHDVREAIGILLNRAHDEARQKTQSRTESGNEGLPGKSARTANGRQDTTPSWMTPQSEGSRSSSQARSQAGGEKDVAKMASDIGNTLFKSANSLWKTSQKKVQKAMADFQQESGDSGQPKWMRDAQASQRGQHAEFKASNVTDEAAMLDAGYTRSKGQGDALKDTSQMRSNGHRPDQESGNRRQPSTEGPAAARRATREQLEHDAPAAYVSPARRRKPQAPQTSAPAAESVSAPKKSPLSTPPVSNKHPFLNVSSKPTNVTQSPLSVRPRAPPRKIPPASSSAISFASQSRLKGTEAFKRGDYADAHAAYTTALQPLPESHPVTIIIFCNRALTSLKNGDPKAAIADAESALAVIGASRGEGEVIDLGHAEGSKDMKEFYGKALMRKAEALEHMEKWAEASKVWHEAVEVGAGGSVSIQGRNRCEKAANPTAQKTPAARIPAAKPRSAIQRPASNHVASQEAVKKLRQANAAAERADDEKFALTDQVDAKLAAWKGSKADNLRALLGSMDKVLWPEAGWTKVGMADLVVANRVKIVYMKAIAKVHPDKVSQSATTEQKMLSAAIFSTLNEAWDKFKQENSL